MEAIKKEKESKNSTECMEKLSWPAVVFFLVFVTWWLAGIVIAKGFWSALFSITMPPYAMYLLVERVMVMMGVV